MTLDFTSSLMVDVGLAAGAGLFIEETFFMSSGFKLTRAGSLEKINTIIEQILERKEHVEERK